jgi:hypothetical protein
MFEHVVSLHILYHGLILIINVYELLLSLTSMGVLARTLHVIVLLIIDGTYRRVLIGRDSILMLFSVCSIGLVQDSRLWLILMVEEMINLHRLAIHALRKFFTITH